MIIRRDAPVQKCWKCMPATSSARRAPSRAGRVSMLQPCWLLIAAFWSFDALRSQTALLFAPHAASRAIPLRHPPRSCFNWFAFAKHAPPHTRPTPSRLLSRIRRFWKNHENWMQVALCAVCCESVRRVTDHVPGRRGARQIRTTSRAAPPLSPRRALDLLPPAFLQRRW